MSDTIKEFIISLGFASDEASEKRFNESMERASKKAFEFGAAMEGIAVVAATALASTARGFTDLATQSEVMRTSVLNINALQFAFTKMGGSAASANAVLSTISESMKANRGNAQLWERLGFQIDEATGKLRGFSAAQEKAGPLGQYDPNASAGQNSIKQYFDQVHLNDETARTFITQHPEDLQKYFEEYKTDAASQGFNPDQAAKDAKAFNAVLTEISNNIDIAKGKWAQSLEDGLLEPLKDVEAFVMAHPIISALIGGAAGKVAYRGVKSFAKDFIGASALDASAGALTGSATALDEAAAALKGAALTKGPRGVPGGIPDGKVDAAEKAAAAAALLKATAGNSGGGVALDYFFKLFRNAGTTGMAWLGGLSAGSLLYGEESGNKGLRDTMRREHPDWSDDQMREWLKSVQSGVNPDEQKSESSPPAPVAEPSSADRHAAYRSLQDAGYNNSFLGIGGASYIDAEVGREESRETRRGRALGGLQEPQGQEQPYRVATATPRQPDDDLRDQRFEALRAMLDIGTSDSARAVTVNGAPVSEGNPLPVTFGQQAQLAAEGAEAFGALNSGGNPGAYRGDPSAAPTDTRTTWEKYAPKWLGGKDAPSGEQGQFSNQHRAGSFWTPEVMKHVSDRLVKEAGLSPMGAAGLVARWAAIEAGAGPSAHNASGHQGINQAGPERRPPGYLGMSLDEQLDYIIKTDLPANAAAYAKAKAAKTAWDGAIAGSMYERAEGYSGASGVDNFTAATPSQRVYDVIHADEQNVPKDVSPVTPPAPAVASAAPSSNIHIPNVYTGGQSSEYPAKTEHNYWQPPAHPEEHPSQVSANPYAPSWMPHIDADWLNDVFAMPHAEAATLPAASHTFNQNNNYKIEGNEPSIVAHQVASRVQRSATDLTTQFKGAVQ